MVKKVEDLSTIVKESELVVQIGKKKICKNRASKIE